MRRLKLDTSLDVIHFDIRIQGTPGKELFAVATDIDSGIEVVLTLDKASINAIFKRCQVAVEARLRGKWLEERQRQLKKVQ